MAITNLAIYVTAITTLARLGSERPGCKKKELIFDLIDCSFMNEQKERPLCTATNGQQHSRWRCCSPCSRRPRTRRLGLEAPTLSSQRRVAVLEARFRLEAAFMPTRRSRPEAPAKLV